MKKIFSVVLAVIILGSLFVLTPNTALAGDPLEIGDILDIYTDAPDLSITGEEIWDKDIVIRKSEADKLRPNHPILEHIPYDDSAENDHWMEFWIKPIYRSVISGNEQDKEGSLAILVYLNTIPEDVAESLKAKADAWLESTGVDISEYDIVYLYSDVVVYDIIRRGIDSLEYESEPEGSLIEIPYTSENGQEVLLTFMDTGDDLFTTKSYNSQKAFCSIEAIQENNYRFQQRTLAESPSWDGVTDGYDFRMFEDLMIHFDFWDTESFQTGEKLSGNDAKGWFTHKKLSDGRDLILTFVQGTDGIEQWLSNLKNRTITGLSGLLFAFLGDHEGFDKASQKVSKELVSYAKRNDIDLSNCFFSFCGYSRGGAIVDALASNSKLPGTNIELNSDNCLAYTFEAPNSASMWSRSNVSHIVNVVNSEDIITFYPFFGHKKGTVLAYHYNTAMVEEFYGTKDINRTWGVGAHYPDNTIAANFSGEPDEEWDVPPSWSWISWLFNKCPTDVYVYNGDDVVAKVVDDEIIYGDGYSDEDLLIIVSEEGGKEVFTPADSNFRYFIEATGDGEMKMATNTLGSEQEFNEPATYDIFDGNLYETNFETNELILYENGWVDVNFNEIRQISSQTAQDSESSKVSNGSGQEDTTKMKVIMVVGLLVLVILIVIFATLVKKHRNKR